jgi:hypothetical protein
MDNSHGKTMKFIFKIHIYLINGRFEDSTFIQIYLEVVGSELRALHSLGRGSAM